MAECIVVVMKKKRQREGIKYGIYLFSNFFFRKVAGYIPFIVKYYGKALQFGNRYLYQTLPRLLTVWLDFDSLKDIKEEEFTYVLGFLTFF